MPARTTVSVVRAVLGHAALRAVSVTRAIKKPLDCEFIDIDGAAVSQ